MIVNLREAVIHLSGVMVEEISDEYIDDYEEITKPDGLKINDKGVVFWNREEVGLIPLKGEVRFYCKTNCPKEVLNYFKESRYKIIRNDDKSTWY